MGYDRAAMHFDPEIRVTESDIRITVPQLGSYERMANRVLLDRHPDGSATILRVGIGVADVTAGELAEFRNPTDAAVFPPTSLDPVIAGAVIRELVGKVHRQARPSELRPLLGLIDRFRVHLWLPDWSRYAPGDKRAFVAAVLRGMISELWIDSVRQSRRA